jgi:acetyltransferase-like isoleucine patch superfamily enzyme
MIHPSATISPNAVIGHNTKVWHWTQVGDGAQIGDDCIIGSAVYIDRDVIVGNRVKIQTAAQLYRGAIVEDGVFIGPSVCLTNDKYPRAIAPDGRLKTDADWVLGRTLVRYGASLGAGSIVLADVEIGRFALVAAGALITESVPDYGLVLGTPARLVGYACVCGRRLQQISTSELDLWACPHCQVEYLRDRISSGLRPLYRSHSV